MILSMIYAFLGVVSTPTHIKFVTVAWPPLLNIFIMGLKCHSVPIMYLFDPPKYLKRAGISAEPSNLTELKTEKIPSQNEALQETLKGMHEASKHILRSQTIIELNDELLT